MGKLMRKCGGIGELAVMEVSQVVGMRTRARTMASAAAAAAARGGASGKRRKAVRSAAEYQIAYLRLRSRSVAITPRTSRSATKDSGGGRISRSSSNASCEAAAMWKDDQEVCEDSETASYYLECSQEQETSSSSTRRGDGSDDLESTAEKGSASRSTAAVMPSDSEIDEFFAVAERNEAKRFVETYNYDVVKDVPLEGRYEWVRITP